MTADLQRPSLRRRVVALASILVLHASFFYLLQHGLFKRVAVAVRETIVFATIFPPALPAAAPHMPGAAPIAPPVATPKVVTRGTPVKPLPGQ